MAHQTRRKRAPVATTRRKKTALLCSIPIPTIASKSSFNDDRAIGTDFYEWVNKAWLHKVKIPPHLNEYSISQEVDDCVSKISSQIIEEEKKGPIADLRDSCLASNQEPSLAYLKEILAEVAAMKTTDDIFTQIFTLCKRGSTGLLTVNNHEEPDRSVHLYIYSSTCALYSEFYKDHSIMYHYTAFMRRIEELFEMPGFSKIIKTEKHLVKKLNELTREEKFKIKGSGLPRKFPSIPWDKFFEIIGFPKWKQSIIYYADPRWFRYIGMAVKTIPLEYWKWYLSRCYIINSLRYLPSPYSDLHYDFFGKQLMGQEIKVPRDELLVRTVHDYMCDDFSKLFWEKAGDERLVGEIADFSKELVAAAKQRIETADWLLYRTRLSAIKKVDSMLIQTVRPVVWSPVPSVSLDPTNFLKNVIMLGERNTQLVLDRIGGKYCFWEDGIYRVNAFYFSEVNKMLIPYASCVPPFYLSKGSALANNYGSLGSVIGHELCHGFDDKGKEYDGHGAKKRWWTRKDNIYYNKRARGLVRLFSKQKVHGKHVDGYDTLSENIADLGGMGIALQALKDNLLKRGVVDPADVKREYRRFFTAFAVSWRTKARERKMERALVTDPHSPAYLRVNMVVRQFDEWYAAFEIDSSAPMFVKPEDRIRIF
jgi:hypothetical protein